MKAYAYVECLGSDVRYHFGGMEEGDVEIQRGEMGGGGSVEPPEIFLRAHGTSLILFISSLEKE